jgi:hypothetical protein
MKHEGVKHEGGQLLIDFDYDERTVRLATEFAIMMAPHLAPKVTKETIQFLSARMATLAAARMKEAYEPTDPIRCHSCDEMTVPATRVRVAVCTRCSFASRTAGSDG